MQIYGSLVNIVTDPPGWFTPFSLQLGQLLEKCGCSVNICSSQNEVKKGSFAFYLSCTAITPAQRLKLNDWNIVVHASDLPKGRGFSPLAWQILEGKNRIAVTMFEMTERVDEGQILMQEWIKFKGNELNNEMRKELGKQIVKMCYDFVINPIKMNKRPQKGAPTWYARRFPKDSQLDPNKTITDQFNLLRVVDNDKYPAFFYHRGRKYVVKIEPDDEKELKIE